MITPVFVYGTLKSTIPVVYQGLEAFGWSLLEKRDAQISGNLHIIPCPYITFPAVGKLNTENLIMGELVYINNLIFLQLLDKIESEGQMYKRVKTTTIDGIECWIYQWHTPDELEYLIEHGNFQYITLQSNEDGYVLGIPMQSTEQETYSIFIPKLFIMVSITGQKGSP